jgi:hypothetical protein
LEKDKGPKKIEEWEWPNFEPFTKTEKETL